MLGSVRRGLRPRDASDNMSLMGDTTSDRDEPIWKALSDVTRRQVLDVLARRPHTTGELVTRFETLSRTAVMKHLDVLEQAGLLVVQREGRVRWNHLDPQPIRRIHDRWVSRHVRGLDAALARLQQHVETSHAIRSAAARRRASPTKTKTTTAKRTTR